jgi:subtilisin family serine protease
MGKTVRLIAIAAVMTLALAGTAEARQRPTNVTTGAVSDYIVVVATGSSTSAATAAVLAAGGTVESANEAVGVLEVSSANASFVTQVSASKAVEGAARDSVIGRAPATSRPSREIERLDAERRAGGSTAATAGGALLRKRPPKIADPLTSLQWDMDAIGAPQAHGVLMGDHRTRVGIMDTGIDGTHPDIAPNFDRRLSRNFTVDIPLIDGPCEVPSCVDPADVDEDGHGTHVAGTIGSPRNGIGIEGVAPGVDLVNVRAGQDSGYFFIGPFVDAMTYAGDIGLDVVNMSFYIDPWLFNCRSNPADSPEAQIEQRTIITATQRAITYAHRKGVTLISAMGNEHTDLGNPTFDDTSPDFPPGAAYERDVDNSCLNLPTEAKHVIGVTSTGPSGRKAYYSNYGIEQAEVAAPGGDYREYFGTPGYATPQNLILAPYPEAVGRAIGDIDENGDVTTDFVVKDCSKGRCSYYQYLQGTSMASPHAVGVAALVVARYGVGSGAGFGLAPGVTQAMLFRSADPTPCPDPATFVYPGLSDIYTATCTGTPSLNGFFGHGEVNALNAVLGVPGHAATSVLP